MYALTSLIWKENIFSGNSTILDLYSLVDIFKEAIPHKSIISRFLCYKAAKTDQVHPTKSVTSIRTLPQANAIDCDLSLVCLQRDKTGSPCFSRVVALVK